MKQLQQAAARGAVPRAPSDITEAVAAAGTVFKLYNVSPGDATTRCTNPTAALDIGRAVATLAALWAAGSFDSIYTGAMPDHPYSNSNSAEVTGCER